MNTDIDAMNVVNQLGAKIANLEVELAIARAKVQALQAELTRRDAEQQKGGEQAA